MSRHVLLTGFEPFGSHSVNPSEMLVRTLEGRIIGDCVVDVRVLPVETRTLRDRLERAFRETRPHCALGIGYGPGRAALGIERLGVNVLDFDVPDASGVSRRNEPIDPAGPDARLSTLPLGEIVSAWASGGVPGYVSDSAGTYLCNQWLYETLALGAAATPPVPAGFIHVPSLPQQAIALGAHRTASMTLELMRRGIESAIETIGQWLERRPTTPVPAAAPAAAATNWFPSRTAKR